MYVYECFASSEHRGQKRVSCPPGTGLTDVCESPRGCWELNSGPQQEQPVLSPAQPSLQTNTFYKPQTPDMSSLLCCFHGDSDSPPTEGQA